jgi:hypothetical protein
MEVLAVALEMPNLNLAVVTVMCISQTLNEVHR